MSEYGAKTSVFRGCLLVLPVMLFVHQMVAGAEGHQVGIIGRCRDGDRTGTAHVGVAQLVGEQLELVSSKTIVIPQYMVVGGSAGALRGDN